MKIKKYLLLFAATTLLCSCGNEFLEEEMVSTITQDYFKTEIGFEQLIVGTYDGLRVSKQYEQGPYSFMVGLDVTNCVRSIPAGQYSGSVWNSTGAVTSNPNGLAGEFAKSLLGYYPTINNCNRAIETIRNGEGLGDYAPGGKRENQGLAEALFNRAYCAYMLNTLYGDVYIPTEYTKALPKNYAFPRTPSADLWTMLIEDLTFAYNNLPTAAEAGSGWYGRATKGAAAFFLSKLYLQRYMGKDYGTTEYGRKADGTLDTSNEKSYLGALYKGASTTQDLTMAIDYADYVIDEDGSYGLSDDYRTIYRHVRDDWSEEGIKDIVLACVFGTPAGGGGNGRYCNRLPYFFDANYSSASWGIPTKVWDYPGAGNATTSIFNDLGFDLYVNKHADSRYEKGFGVEWVTADGLVSSEQSAYTANKDYPAYNDPSNQTYTWTKEMADYFNANILPTYDRPSWGGRKAVAGEHKMGTGDIGLAYVENTKETALEIDEVLAQPYFVYARWMKKDGKYYYRLGATSENGTYSYNTGNYNGLDKGSKTMTPNTIKYFDPNRLKYGDYNSTRDVPLFTVAEAYLMRALAKGLNKDMTGAVADINKVRVRAAYKPGENRAEVLAKLQPGHENLTAKEQQWPYAVEKDMSEAMKITADVWGSGAAASGEFYPATATTEEQKFVNFVINEMAREFSMEMHYYEWLHHSGWQADRIRYGNQLGSAEKGLWDSSDNGVTGNGLGGFKPAYTLKAFHQTLIDLLTDENNVIYDEAGKKAYQNYGY